MFIDNAHLPSTSTSSVDECARFLWLPRVREQLSMAMVNRRNNYLRFVSICLYLYLYLYYSLCMARRQCKGIGWEGCVM